MLNIAVFVSGGGTNLQALIDAQDRGEIKNGKIIKYDINFSDKFYWCECSDAIEHYYDKFDGFKIPNAYAQEILNIKSEADKPIVLMDDGYHYRRYSKSLERYFIKIIYG